MPLNKDIKKVLVIGSGPIVIGQAAEFDYAGAQACRVLKDEGIEVVLVNSNPATIIRRLPTTYILSRLRKKRLKELLKRSAPIPYFAVLAVKQVLQSVCSLQKTDTLTKWESSFWERMPRL